MTSLSESIAPFERLREPGEIAYEIAGSIEHALTFPRLHDRTVTEWARIVQPEIDKVEKRYIAMETAFAAAIQIAQINGASEAELRHLNDLLNKTE